MSQDGAIDVGRRVSLSGAAGDVLFLGFAALSGFGFHLVAGHPVLAVVSLAAALLLLRAGQHWIASPMEAELADLRTEVRVLLDNVDVQQDLIRIHRREARQQRRLVAKLSSRLMEWCEDELAEQAGDDLPDPPN